VESEVAQLKWSIEQECRALRLVMDGFAIGASHQAISARYERLGVYQEELEKLIGPQAEELLCEMYNLIMG
jgi:hypothetical protein